MGIWLLRTYLEKIPRELEEAAYVDGASRLYTLRRVVLPLAVPGLIVVSVAVFIGAYAQQFLFAITFNQVREYQPLPAGLFEFIGYQEVVWNEMMAAALVGVLPVLLIFLFLQKYLVKLKEELNEIPKTHPSGRRHVCMQHARTRRNRAALHYVWW